MEAGRTPGRVGAKRPEGIHWAIVLPARPTLTRNAHRCRTGSRKSAPGIVYEPPQWRRTPAHGASHGMATANTDDSYLPRHGHCVDLAPLRLMP
jgi:hypothetical protein